MDVPKGQLCSFYTNENDFSFVIYSKDTGKFVFKITAIIQKAAEYFNYLNLFFNTNRSRFPIL